MVEAAIGQQHLVQCIFAGMAEGRVAEVVHQGHALCQILVKFQGAGERAGDLRHLNRMRQPGAIVIAILGDEDLGLVLQPAEGRRVDDAVAVALEV